MDVKRAEISSKVALLRSFKDSDKKSETVPCSEVPRKSGMLLSNTSIKEINYHIQSKEIRLALF